MVGIATIDVDGAGLSLVSSVAERETIFGSDEAPVTVERLQFTLGEGPCVDASTSDPVLVPDLEDSGAAARWPAFLAEAVEAGVRDLFAFPVRAGTIALSVRDMYRRAPGALTPEDLAAARGIRRFQEDER